MLDENGTFEENCAYDMADNRKLQEESPYLEGERYYDHLSDTAFRRQIRRKYI